MGFIDRLDPGRRPLPFLRPARLEGESNMFYRRLFLVVMVCLALTAPAPAKDCDLYIDCPDGVLMFECEGPDGSIVDWEVTASSDCFDPGRADHHLRALRAG